MSGIIYGYWQGYTKSAEAPRSLEDTPDGVDVVALAFGVIDQHDPNRIDTGFLTSKWSEDEIRTGIASLRKRGTKVVLSVNGQPALANGGWPDLDPNTFAANTGALLADWNLDGVDLDNENKYDPGDAFASVISSLRTTLGAGAIISLPVDLGAARDAYLSQVREDVSYVWTMTYSYRFPRQQSTLASYQALVGDERAGMGIGIPGMADAGQGTHWESVSQMAAYAPQAGIMIWALNSLDTLKWYDEIVRNMPGRMPSD